MPKISDEKKEERKKLILSSAAEVFGMKGYSEASIDDIVKHSGISKGGIYTYFPTKEAIFLEIAEQRFEARSHLVKDLNSIPKAADRIETYIRWLLETLDDPKVVSRSRFSFEFWTVISRNPEKGYLAKSRYEKFAGELESVILYGIEQKEFRGDLEVKSAVLILLSAMDGIGFMSTVMGNKINGSDIKEFVSMFTNHWRAKV